MFDRFDHPRLAAAALAGFGWWLIGLLLGVAGPDSLGYVSSVTHLLGLGTLVLVGVVYGVLWWTGELNSRIGD